MKTKDKSIAALMAVFPNHDVFRKFYEESSHSKAVESFVAYAAKSSIIETADVKSLELLIHKHARTPDDCTPPNHLTFETLLEKKADLLKMNLSVRALADRINTLISECRIDLPKVDKSMLSRLKKEPADTIYKQDVLRSLAFWLGHERAELGPLWNYETLVKLCFGSKQTANHKEGVRVGFALYSRGDVIDHEIVGWLKKVTKGYIEQSLSQFLYGRWGKIHSHDITTLYIDFPKEEKVSDPLSYRQCLKCAISLAHQIAIRWSLSKYCSKNRFLSIGIVVGDYAGLDNYLLPILNAKLPGDPVVRVSDYARQFLLISDIRAILCQKPTEITLFNGESLSIWWVAAFWSALYFDFVRDLLEDNVLQNDPGSAKILNRLLWTAGEKGLSADDNDEPNAIINFFRFPHNSLLGVEIAKTLFYRRRFTEAKEILRIVLSIDPTELTARTLRLELFRNMAVDAPSYCVADGLFKMAEQEALYITANCACQSEEFYSEYAMLYLAKAVMMIKHMRRNDGFFQGLQNNQPLKEIVFSAFEKTEDLFQKGITVSPSGIRSSYLLACARILKTILRNDEDIFINPAKPIDGQPEIVRKASLDLLMQLGFVSGNIPIEAQQNLMEQIAIKNQEVHDDSISLQAYRPTTYYCHAVALWDMLPIRTVAMAKRAFQVLRQALETAKSQENDDVCIYSVTRNFGEMITVQEFIQDMEKSMQLIESTTGGNLFKRDDHEVIKPQGKWSSMLMTLNF